jgi:hypothetical protein
MGNGPREFPREVQGQRRCPVRRSERGSAVLVMLVLVACMVLFALSNTATLDTLSKELKFIDQQQQEKYGQGPGH